MPRMVIRGLCVCSFGLRTIAVLMSLFPSLGISSFHTAVCCDGENEYTTPAPVCQPLFAFFLDFFAFFFAEGGFFFFLHLQRREIVLLNKEKIVHLQMEQIVVIILQKI